MNFMKSGVGEHSHFRGIKGLVSEIFRRNGYQISLSSPRVTRIHPFQWNTSIASKLNQDFLKKESWNASNDRYVAGNELYELWKQIPEGHKWHHYFPIYEKIFSPLRDRKLRILEIGVYKGASIELWRRYFNPQSVIVGIDIDESCKRFDDPHRGVNIRIGPQQDPAFLKVVGEEFGPFDLIVDDGSHVSSHMIDSFNILFNDYLSDSGVYFIEDTHANYWLSHRDDDVSFLDFAKGLTDLMNYHYTNLESELYFRIGAPTALTAVAVPRITKLIDEIRFFDSVVVIYKNKDRTLPVCEHL